MSHSRTYCFVYLQAVRPKAQAGNKNDELGPLALFDFFVKQCQQNLHIMIAFSPIGDAFRNRLRQFPSLINCCTIDWFQVNLQFVLLRKNIEIKFRTVVKKKIMKLFV